MGKWVNIINKSTGSSSVMISSMLRNQYPVGCFFSFIDRTYRALSGVVWRRVRGVGGWEGRAVRPGRACLGDQSGLGRGE